MNHIMAIYDQEENYAIQFINYLKMRNDFPFEVRNFSSIEKMQQFNRQQKIDVALIGEKSLADADSMLDVQIIILSETGVINTEGLKSVYKYQNCENIIKKILILVSEGNVTQGVISRQNDLKIISFYTPVKRTYQTSFALIMGQMLSKKYRTLYINMEGFSGLSHLLNKKFTKDISDLLYYLQNGKKGLQYLMGSMIEKMNGLDILPPMMYQMDLISITGNEWIHLLKEIERYSDYEYLLLDLSDSVQGLYDILRQSSVIYCMLKKDEYAVAKIEQYESMLNQCSYEDLLLKTKKHILPDFKYTQLTIDKLITGELADYVRNIIQEEFYE